MLAEDWGGMQIMSTVLGVSALGIAKDVVTPNATQMLALVEFWNVQYSASMPNVAVFSVFAAVAE